MVRARAVRVVVAMVVGVAAWCVGVGAAVGAPGDLDTSFSTDGILTTDVGPSPGSNEDSGRAVVVDSTGRIVVAGYSYNGSNQDFTVLRYTSAGELDTSFSTDGIVTTAIGSSADHGYAVALDSAGRIIVAGRSYNGSNYDFAVVRYNVDGSLDTSFSTDGIVLTDFGNIYFADRGNNRIGKVTF